MTDPNGDNTAVQIPSLITQLAHNYAQKLVTMAATALLANGFLQTGQEAQFISIGVGALTLLGSVAWTYFKTRLDHKRTEALAAGAPVAAPKP